jgi:hypothetical protein
VTSREYHQGFQDDGLAVKPPSVSAKPSSVSVIGSARPAMLVSGVFKNQWSLPCSQVWMCAGTPMDQLILTSIAAAQRDAAACPNGC